MSYALDGSEDDQTLEWFPQEIGMALPHDGDAAAAAAAEESASDASLTSDEESPVSDSDVALFFKFKFKFFKLFLNKSRFC